MKYTKKVRGPNKEEKYNGKKVAKTIFHLLFFFQK